MTNRTSPLLILVAMALAPATAHAQPAAWGDHGYVHVSGWFQPAAATFSTSVRPIDFAEASIVDTSYKTRSIPGFEVDGGWRVWRNLAIGAGVSRFSKASGGSVAAQVPHPFFFNRARSVAGDASGLTRDETALHLQALWMIPLRNRWQLAIAGGPSWFSVGQDLVSDVTVTQTYPYDAATFASATVVHRSHAAIGFNAGADLAYGLRPHVGVGIGVNFSRAAIHLDDTTSVDAGGAHVAGGLRFRF
jgi:hypothetical protein